MNAHSYINRYLFLVVGLLLVSLLSACGTAVTPNQAVTPTQAPIATVSVTSAPSSTPGIVPSTASPQPASPTAGSTATAPSRTIKWQEVAAGLRRPVDLAALPDDTGRLLILEQPGYIRVFDGKSIRPELFMDINGKVGSQANEQGLLGIALHPRFSENKFFYVNYTDRQGNTVIARFTASANSDRADPASEKILLQARQPFVNHNGGSMAFGPDGYLYIGLGDGGSGGDPQGNGQNTNTLLGKLLRIDVNSGDRYAIPNGNPFASGGGLPEIWAYGLRNPWRFSFDRQTGDLYIADVGQNKLEEIDFLPAPLTPGINYGWRYKEGTNSFQGQPPAGAKLVDPIWEYGRDIGCSVTGGFVYRGKALPELAGIYFYSDYCNGTVWGLKRDTAGKWQNQEMFKSGSNPSSFGQDKDGELYILDHNAGRILKLIKN